MKTCQYYVGGKWQHAAGGATFEIRKPFSGEPFARIPAAGNADEGKVISPAAQA